jgi:hypothetical protein
VTRYAENTSVSVEKSRGEIERLLTRYGATAFGYAWENEKAAIEFVLHDRRVRLIVPSPDKRARQFTHTPSGRPRQYAEDIEKAWEQACRSCWRSMKLIIQAKLEAIESGITTLDDEFLPHLVLPDGLTFSEWAQPQIERVYAENEMPSMLELNR